MLLREKNWSPNFSITSRLTTPRPAENEQRKDQDVKHRQFHLAACSTFLSR